MNKTIYKHNVIEITFNTEANFRGIDVEHSNDARINCNTIINLPVSMRFLGSCDGTLLRKNAMAGYNEGIRLESATVGDQYQVNNTTGDEEPLDNIWNDPPLATNTPTDRVTGTTNGGAFNWYFRSQGGIYDPLDNGTTSQIIATVPDAGVMVDCSAQSNNQNRMARFGRTVGDSLMFELFEEENTWFAISYTYVSMSRDTTILYQDTLTDAPFISFYNETDSSNIGRFQLVACLSPDSASRVSAASLNLSITPALDLESALQTVWDKYLTIVAAGDTLTGSDTLLLEQVADLDYFSGGRAIYMAAAMLGKEVTPSIPPLRINPGNVNNPGSQPPTTKKQLKIYPNPATTFFVLTGSDIEFKGGALYDMHNKKVMEWDYILPDLPVSLNVISGIYAIRVITQNNEVYWGKLAIIGR